MYVGCANRIVESVTAFIGGSLLWFFIIKWPKVVIPLIVLFFFLLSIVTSIQKSFRERNRRKCPHGIVDGDRMDKQHATNVLNARQKEKKDKESLLKNNKNRKRDDVYYTNMRRQWKKQQRSGESKPLHPVLF